MTDRMKSNISATSSTLSTLAIQNIVDSLKMDRIRDTTKKNYYAIWKLFNQFFIKLDVKPDAWEQRLVLFAGFLAGQNKKATTIKSYVSAIKAVLLNIDVEINEDRFLLNSITRACSYRNDVARTKLPIHKGLLKLLLQELGRMFDAQPYLRWMYQALFSTAYFGLFRVGELTKGDHPIRASDVHIGLNKKKLLILLRTSKTHWKSAKPQIVKINSYDINVKKSQSATHNKGNFNYCPYLMLKKYAGVRRSFKSVEEMFFVFRYRSPVLVHHFRKVLKQALLNCGFDSRLYCCQSFRSGRAGDLLDMGLSVETIKKLGRWKLNAIYRYFR